MIKYSIKVIFTGKAEIMEVRRIPTYGMASNCYVISDGRGVCGH